MTKKKTSRNQHTRVKSARGRKLSSTLWLQRQLNDPYVKRAKEEGYRSRAAYKLLELNEQFNFLKQGMRVVDLGAAPGGWAQVAARITGSGNKKPLVLGIDLLEISPLPGATFIQEDFLSDSALEALHSYIGEKVDVVLSDMAPNSTGHAKTDHIRIMNLCEAAFEFAREVLAPEGSFVAKVWQGGTEQQLLNHMKQHFQKVRHAKPKASRADSAEMYVVATGFKA